MEVAWGGEAEVGVEQLGFRGEAVGADSVFGGEETKGAWEGEREGL